jgi:uncharacterized membrane protein (DUF106 family)
MLTKPLRIIIYLLVAIVAVMVILYIYRIMFLFDRKKVNEYKKMAAETTGNPNAAYKILTEQVEALLKSSDDVACIKQMAAFEKVEKEDMLVNTAWSRAIALGFLENPLAVQSVSPGLSMEAE